MEKIYRYVLVTILIVLLIWGIWYIYACYQGKGAHEEGILVEGTMRKEDMKQGADHGTGNYIY